MSSIIVSGLDEAVKQQLAAQAKERGRSMEAEVRDILTKAARRPHIGMSLMSAARETGGIEDLPLPARDDVALTGDVAITSVTLAELLAGVRRLPEGRRRDELHAHTGVELVNPWKSCE